MFRSRNILISIIIIFSFIFISSSVSADSNRKYNASNIMATLNGVAYGNGTYVAVGDSGVITTSTDGLEWVARESGVFDKLFNVIWNGNIFIAVGGTYPNGGIILTSSDGVSWTCQILDIEPSITDIAWDGNQFVACGGFSQDSAYSEHPVILTSNDGVTWAEQQLPTNKDLYCIDWNGSIFAAAGDEGTIITSADGVEWTKQTSNITAPINDIATAGSGFIAVGGGTYHNGTVIISEDGNVWTIASGVPAQPLSSVYWNGEKFIAVGFGQVNITSSDGNVWTQLVKLLKLDINNKENIFTDVKADKWYAGYVNAAFKAGLVNGVGGNKFAPNAEITAQEAAVILVKALKYKGIKITKGSASGIQDIGNVSKYAQDAVVFTVLKGITLLDSKGCFKANSAVNRATAAEFLYKVFNYKE